ncbi:MAG: AbrB/MazE/SpoVT family DNA-binding domain-containing protein [Firmicutes bacterium]|nr:AbrB/MazE/SpoVT family DNA-binding domain-containing protein [Bacillota bacterium]
MKATGIVRRIDDLGRVVIPKEIRRNLRIREGEPLEIFVDGEGKIILQKYSPVGELSGLAAEYAAAIHEAIGMPVFISDRDIVIAAEGVNKRDYLGRTIGSLPERAMRERRGVSADSAGGDTFLAERRGGDLPMKNCLAIPIIAQGDPVGVVAVCGDVPLGDAENKVARSAAGVLGRQLDA